MSQPAEASKTLMQKLLDVVEKVGNKVPHPAVDPEAVLAAYRVADSPINAITPLNAYFALVV